MATVSMHSTAFPRGACLFTEPCKQGCLDIGLGAASFLYFLLHTKPHGFRGRHIIQILDPSNPVKAPVENPYISLPFCLTSADCFHSNGKERILGRTQEKEVPL